MRERWWCLLVLNSVTSTPKCIRQPRSRKLIGLLHNYDNNEQWCNHVHVFVSCVSCMYVTVCTCVSRILEFSLKTLENHTIILIISTHERADFEIFCKEVQMNLGLVEESPAHIMDLLFDSKSADLRAGLFKLEAVWMKYKYVINSPQYGGFLTCSKYTRALTFENLCQPRYMCGGGYLWGGGYMYQGTDFWEFL